MRIVLYCKKPDTSKAILDRAAGRAHLVRKTLLWDLLLLALLLGSVLFLHSASPHLSKMPILRYFIPANTSVWEHLKLLCLPACLTAVIRYAFTGDLQRGILTTYAEGLLLVGIAVTAGLYTLRGITGSTAEWQDIGVLCAGSVALCIYLRKRAGRQKWNNLPGMLVLLLLEAAMIYCTDHPPMIGLFMPI